MSSKSRAQPLARSADVGNPRGGEAVMRLVDVAPLVPRQPRVTSRPDWMPDPPRTWKPLMDVLSPADQENQRLAEKERDQALGVVFREAYEEGLRASRRAVEAIMGRYHQAIAQLEVLRQEMMSATEMDLAELALGIARELVLGDDQAREAFTFKMIEHALTLLREADTITLHLSATDLAAVREKRPDLLEGGTVRLVEDTELNLGGVIAECELGRVDASLETRLHELASGLLSQARSETLGGGANDDQADDTREAG